MADFFCESLFRHPSEQSIAVRVCVIVLSAYNLCASDRVASSISNEEEGLV